MIVFALVVGRAAPPAEDAEDSPPHLPVPTTRPLAPPPPPAATAKERIATGKIGQAVSVKGTVIAIHSVDRA
jgi:hypothetical protein